LSWLRYIPNIKSMSASTTKKSVENWSAGQTDGRTERRTDGVQT